MHRIAVLLTCFNRKEKTLAALNYVFEAYHLVKDSIHLDIYLTDDGSTDGTGDAIRNTYPEVKILKGNGALYWAGGMRNSWTAALREDHEFYLLLNDDTEIYDTTFQELMNAHKYCMDKYGQSGIYVGSTTDSMAKKITYGGSVYTNRFLARYVRIIPNGKTHQECELANANILLVHKEVVKKIGILSEGFQHGLADFDYSLMAKNANIPVLLTPNILGVCDNEHKNPYKTLHLLSFSERLKILYSPIGLDFKSNLHFMRRNFPHRLPFVFIAGWFKIIFPKYYFKSHTKRLEK